MKSRRLDYRVTELQALSEARSEPRASEAAPASRRRASVARRSGGRRRPAGGSAPRGCPVRRSGRASRNRIASAARIDESRWAITITTRVRAASRSAPMMRASDSGSSAEVGSSRIRMPGVAHQRARDRQPLLLASGELSAGAPEPGPVALGQRAHEVVGSRAARGAADLLVARVGTAEAQVVLDAGVEERRLLEDEGGARAQRGQRRVLDVDARRSRLGRRSGTGSAAAARRASSCRCPPGRPAP